MEDRTSIKILIAEDHRILLEGLTALLNKEHDIEVVAEATNGREALRRAKKVSPDIIIMDVSLPELNGIDATRQLTEEMPKVRVLALSAFSESTFVSEMLKAGAKGYLLKDCIYDELVQAIRAIHADHMFLSSKIANIVIEEFKKDSSDTYPSVFTSLTSRQREVLQLISEGKNTKEIATTLHLSPKTIETYRRQLFDVLKVESVAELTRYAIREGISPE